MTGKLVKEWSWSPSQGLVWFPLPSTAASSLSQNKMEEKLQLSNGMNRVLTSVVQWQFNESVPSLFSQDD
jgi:hypothetical protein